MERWASKLLDQPIQFLVILGVIAALVFAWLLCKVVSYCRRPVNGKAECLSLFSIWLHVLTHYPCFVLLVGILAPCHLSWEAWRASNYSMPNIDRDFAGYLRAEVPVMWTESAVLEASRQQKAKLGHRRRRNAPWSEWSFQSPVRRLAANSSSDMNSAAAADQQSQSYRSFELHIFYQERHPRQTSGNGGVFDPAALEEIRAFEIQLESVAHYDQYCLHNKVSVDDSQNGTCKAMDSATKFFFTTPSSDRLPGLTLTSRSQHAIAVLQSLANNGSVTWMDKYFGSDNLTSQYTRATFKGGEPLVGYKTRNDRRSEQNAKQRSFLRELYNNVLVSHSAELMMLTWYEEDLLEYEIMQTLGSDALWAIGSCVVVAALVCLNLLNVFISFWGLTGIVLSFSTTYYFYHVCMGYHSMSVLDCVSLFLIMGIGADDMLVIYSAYHMVPAMLSRDVEPRERMRVAYWKAASACGVTSLTTAASFYANCVSAVTVVKRFGFFMGTLVLCNFVNVMVIFPAAILVNDLYIVGPIRRTFFVTTPGQDADDLIVPNASSPPGDLLVLQESTFSGMSSRSSANLSYVCQNTTTTKNFRISFMPPRNTIRGSVAETVARGGSTVINGVGRVSAVVRTFSPRPNWGSIKLDVAQMNIVERFFYEILAACMWKCRFVFVILGLTVGTVGAYLGAMSFVQATGEMRIFSTSQNAGRVQELRRTVFPAEATDLLSSLSSSGLDLSSIASLHAGGLDGTLVSQYADSFVDNASNASNVSLALLLNASIEASQREGSDARHHNSRILNANAAEEYGNATALNDTNSSVSVRKKDSAEEYGDATALDDTNSSVSARKKEPLTSCVEVMLIWGIHGYDELNVSAPSYDSNFDFFDSNAQSWVREAARRVRNQTSLKVRDEQRSWIEAWELWIASKGGQFPVLHRDLSTQALQAFMVSPMMPFYESDVGTLQEGHSGKPLFVRLRFIIDMARTSAPDLLEEEYMKWVAFTTKLNSEAPASLDSPALLVSKTFSSMLVEREMAAETVEALSLSLLVTLGAVTLFTGNWILALFVAINIILVLAALFGFLTYGMGYTFGTVEAIGATMFAGLSVDYCVHLAHCYHLSLCSGRKAKIRDCLAQVGPSIVGGAATTLFSTVFLLPCKILLFVQLGTMLCANAFFSICLTFCFLVPLLSIAGPMDDVGELSAIMSLPACLKRAIIGESDRFPTSPMSASCVSIDVDDSHPDDERSPLHRSDVYPSLLQSPSHERKSSWKNETQDCQDHEKQKRKHVSFAMDAHPSEVLTHPRCSRPSSFAMEASSSKSAQHGVREFPFERWSAISADDQLLLKHVVSTAADGLKLGSQSQSSGESTALNEQTPSLSSSSLLEASSSIPDMRKNLLVLEVSSDEACEYLPFQIRDAPVLLRQGDSYLVDNSQLKSQLAGLTCRSSKNIEDRCERIIRFGSTVDGSVEDSEDGAKWLKVTIKAELAVGSYQSVAPHVELPASPSSSADDRDIIPRDRESSDATEWSLMSGQIIGASTAEVEVRPARRKGSRNGSRKLRSRAQPKANKPVPQSLDLALSDALSR